MICGLMLIGYCGGQVAAQAIPIGQLDLRASRTDGVAGILIVDYTGPGGTIVIPREFNGIPVRSINNSAFNQSKLFSVTIPNGITSIGHPDIDHPNNPGAFANNLLTSVTIPNSVTTIAVNAFRNNLIASVVIPNSVTRIGFGAFMNNLLSNITIPSSVRGMDGSAFANNPLTSITIGANVTLGTNAFPGNFQNVYNGVAGTYVRDDVNSNWRLKE